MLGALLYIVHCIPQWKWWLYTRVGVTKSISITQKVLNTWVAADQARTIRLQYMLPVWACWAHDLTWLWWSIYWHFWPREIGGEKVEEKTGSWGCSSGWKIERHERKRGKNNEHRGWQTMDAKERRPKPEIGTAVWLLNSKHDANLILPLKTCRF